MQHSTGTDEQRSPFNENGQVKSMDQVTFSVAAGLAVTLALYVRLRAGMILGRRDGIQEGKLQTLRDWAVVNTRR